MMHIVRKSYFTLLELLIVFLLISFGIALTGVKVAELYREQRFLSESQQVVSQLSIAQDLMLIMDTDVTVRIAPDKNNEQLHIWLEVEKPIEEHWMRLIERKIPLKAIQSLKFKGNTSKDLTLLFSLGKMSKGKLVLFEDENDHSEDQRRFEIRLPGYPSPIGTQKKSPKNQTKAEKSEMLYPVEIFQKLYADPNEKKPKP